MREYLVYAVGPVTGLGFDQANEWREYADEKLQPRIRIINPLRGQRQWVKTSIILECDNDHSRTSAPALARYSKFDVKRCDAILANFLEAQMVSRLSLVEIGWANAFDKPIVVVMEKDNIHYHEVFVDICGIVVKSLDEGIEILKTLLYP